MASSTSQSKFVSAPDGLRLHYREYGDMSCSGGVVVCLPGLTRSWVDFDALASFLHAGGAKPRRVLALDYRGRGLSEYDKNWENYNLAIESQDIIATLIAAQVDRASFIGTSRGGLHIMALAAIKPSLLQAAVLNDVGPIVEGLGLIRIKNYLGQNFTPASWTQATQALKQLHAAQFTGLSERDWAQWAQMTWSERDGKLISRYDPALVHTLAGVGVDMPQVDLWPQFLALADIPLLILRGAHSDILSPQTYQEMLRRAPKAQGCVMEGQGHAPLLINQAELSAIEAFISTHVENV